MKVVNYEEYSSEKKAFMEKHDYDYSVSTSSMDQYGTYYKTYTFKDGAIFYETMMRVCEKVTVEVHKVAVTVDVEFFRTEYWSNEFESRYYYEKY